MFDSIILGLPTRTWTLFFIAAVLVAIIVYDTFVATNGIFGDTISEVTLEWAMKRPISVLALGVAIGVLLGHLFWPQIRAWPPMK